MPDQKGFTLVEIIAVLLIVSVLAAVVVPRFIDLDSSARVRAVEAAIAELNGRESLLWARLKISQTGYSPADGDDIIWSDMKNDPTDSFPYLGEDYVWTGLPTQEGGGQLSFQNSPGLAIDRTKSTRDRPGNWARP
jgi:prepilin-type N-terminal cleavage/methylation domain-containing protein